MVMVVVMVMAMVRMRRRRSECVLLANQPNKVGATRAGLN